MDLGHKPWAVPQIRPLGVPQKRKPLLIGLIALAVVVLFTVAAIAKPVTVIVGGKKSEYLTVRQNVGEFLDHANLNIFPEDLVVPGRQALIQRGMTITVQRSVPVNISLDGHQMALRILGNTVGQAITGAEHKFGFSLKQSDEVVPGRDSSLRPNLTIVIRTAVPITITADGKTRHIEIAPRTVADVLTKENIKVGLNDLITPSLDTMVSTKTAIKVVRVTQKTTTVESHIPYQVVAKPGDFPVGMPDQVLAAGEEGLSRQVVKLTLADGVVAKRQILSQRIVRKPVDEVVAQGAQTTISRGGNIINFKRAITVRATAYSEPGGSTSLGVPVHRGVVAVDPNVIPYYSSLWIDGYGMGSALDTGGAIRGRSIDLYFDNAEDARNWGVRYVTVYLR
ncbi:MAG: ubiquitin-like domain-containing protein [Peptococcaceae bacterium]|nr:ubiquitin-like domain-containing protein [Peptococcaceae bacterium]